MNGVPRKWKVLAIIFMVLSGILLLTTFLFATYYSLSTQSLSLLSTKVESQKKIIKQYKEDIKDYQKEIEEANGANDSGSSGFADDPYSIGDTADYKDGTSVTVTAIKEDETLELEDVPKGYKKVAVSITFVNNSTSSVSIDTEDFYLYDSADNYGDLNTYTDSKGSVPDTIEAGEKASFKIYYTIPKAEPYMLSYGDAYWLTDGSESGQSV